MNKIKMILGSIVSATVALTSGVIATAPAYSLNTDECLPAVLMLRGSGEPAVSGEYQQNGQTIIDTNGGWEGPTLEKLLESFANQTDVSSTTSKVRFVGINYEALEVEPSLISPPPGLYGGVNQVVSGGVNSFLWTEHIINYMDSYRDGAEKIADFINNDVNINGAACNTQYMLVGYSQGVLSVRLALALYEESNLIRSTYVVGDPFQKANGAISPRQITVANTSPHTDGVGRNASNFLYSLSNDVANNDWAGLSTLAALNAFSGDFITADPIIYREDPEEDGGIVSRSLCHEYDPTCGFDFENIVLEQHTNYFDSSQPAGELDLNLEVAEFDKQIRDLALAPSHSIGYRGLNHTSPVKGQNITYNISNARPMDKCWWDENSDGIIDKSDVKCSTPFTIPVDSDVESMSVTIVDSDGQEYFFSTATSSIDPSEVASLFGLDPDKWYQFHPYEKPTACLGLSQPDLHTITGGSHTSDIEVSIDYCNTTSPEGFEETANTATQAFNFNWHYDDWSSPQAPAGISYPPSKKLINGYDDTFYLESIPGNNQNSSVHDDITLATKDFKPKEYAITPRLAQIINGVPYYALLSENQNCVTHSNYGEEDPWFGLIYLENGCSVGTDQLFSVTPVNVSELGNLSWEDDVTPPDSINNLNVNNLYRNTATLTWDVSQDNRDGQVTYNIYRENSNIKVGSYLKENTVTIDLSQTNIGDSNTFSVEAVDNAANKTERKPISFITPDLLPAPEAPILQSSETDRVTIEIPNENIPDGSIINIYRDGVLLDSTYSYVYEDTSVSQGNVYEYAYEVLTPVGGLSALSNPLTVNLMVNDSPPAPANLSVVSQSEQIITLSWEPVETSQGGQTRYHVYRNGMIISDYVFTDTLFTDYNASNGANTYTVRAEDENGNLSEESTPVTVVVALDVTAPTIPTFSNVQKTESSLSFDINSTDDVGVLHYLIYRDGELVRIASEPFMEDFGLTPNTEYTYTVTAVDEAGNVSSVSEPLVLTTLSDTSSGNEEDTDAPSKPVLLVDNIMENAISFTIHSTDNVEITGYKIYRDGVYQTNIYNNSYFDGGLAPNFSYTYEVVAIDSSSNESEKSDPLTITTLNPVVNIPVAENLQTKYAAHNVTYLSWSVSQPWLISSYDIYRDEVLIKSGHYDTSYVDREVAAGTQYEYTVIAKNWNGDQASASQPLTITTLPESTQPDSLAPSSFEFKYPSYFNGTVYLSWSEAVDSSTNVTYKVYRDNVLITTVPNLYFNDSSIAEGSTYEYKIIAIDEFNNETLITTPFTVTAINSGGMG